MSKKKILIVDDNEADLNLMVQAVNGRGYQIITASDGEEALEKALAELPHLILLDILLPKKNGFQICRQLKTTPATAHIRIVLVSGKNQESDRFWGLKQGADEYITKPFKGDELLRALEKHI